MLLRALSSKFDSRQGSIAIVMILLIVFACVHVPHFAKASPDDPPQFRNVGPANGTSISVGENLTLFAQGYDDAALDWAWLSTNETGTWENYTLLWSDWQASESNPLIDGDSVFGSGYWTEDSKILKVNGTYYMCISSGSSNSAMEIYMMNSSSLTGPWSVMNDSDPIIHQSTSGWDQGQLRMGSITYYDGTYYLYYMGTNASGAQSIGVATTSDTEFPNGWSKYDGNPILEPQGGGWESGGIYSLDIKRVGPPGNEWYGHYSATDKLGPGGGYWSIGICYGDSPYGPFTRHGDNPILERGVGEWDNLGLPRTDLIKIGDTIYGAYEAASTSSPWDFQVGEYSGEITDDILNVAFSKNPNNPIIAGDAGSGTQSANPCWWYENETRYLFAGGAVPPYHWQYIDLFSSSAVTKHGSPMDMYNVAASWTWSNFTWSNSSIAPGTTIHWRIYYSDTDGNVNGTGVHSFTVEAPEYDYVDLDTSDVDSSADKGTHSNFDNEKACDSSYDTLSEENTGGFGGMSYRKNVTINHNYIDGDQLNFPGLIDIYDADLHTDVQSSGNDIDFTDSSGRDLDHEIEYFNKDYNGTHAHLVAWVNTNLTGILDTTICMIYGNPLCGSRQNPAGVWDSEYVAVYHLLEAALGVGTTALYQDSTLNNNDGDDQVSATGKTGKIDGGQEFDGSDDYIKVDDSPELGLEDNAAFEAWIKADALSGYQVVLRKAPNNAVLDYTEENYGVFLSDDEIYFEFYSAGSYRGHETTTANLQVGNWYHLVVAYDDGNDRVKIYLNGSLILDESQTNSLVDFPDTHLRIGDRYVDNSHHFDGYIDEVRISNATRTAAWINTTYQNTHNLADFFSVGSEELSASPTSYELDLEIQWTNVNYTHTDEELCIRTGAFSGSEDIQVRIWNSTDSSWNPIMDLTANQWNNVSVTSYLTESTFTIQFLGGTESGDTSQDSWNIECSLIHTWGQARLYINPSLIVKTHDDVSTTFEVNATIQNVIDLWGFDFNLTWNNTLITLVDVEFNNSLDNIWGSLNWFVAVNETGPGTYQLAALSTSTSFNSIEPTPLATLTFHVEGPICNSMKETSIHFETHKLSDSNADPILKTTEDGTYRIIGQTPTLQMSPSTVTFRKYNATHPYSFTIEVNVSDACNLEDFKFEIHFNTTLLDYANISWDAWPSGTINLGELNGNITGSTSGTPKTGNLTLITVTFNVTYAHIWKNLTGWVNDQSGTIYFQWANLSYPDAPDLRYEKGLIYEISVDPTEVNYTFSPIQGDLLLDGLVDIWDLRTVAAFYDREDVPTYNLTGEDIIDIFDLVIVGSNFGGT